jgi:hypothetical protein
VRIVPLLVIAGLVAACTDESGPHWDDECIASHTILFPMLVGKVVVLMPQKRCEEWRRVCVTGKDYRGTERECKPE